MKLSKELEETLLSDLEIKIGDYVWGDGCAIFTPYKGSPGTIRAYGLANKDEILLWYGVLPELPKKQPWWNYPWRRYKAWRAERLVNKILKKAQRDVES